MASTQAAKAEAFRALHEGGIFLTPNPWDAGELGVRRAAVRELAQEGLRSWAVRRYGQAGQSELRRAGLAIVDFPYLRHPQFFGRAPAAPIGAAVEEWCRPSLG